MNKLKTLLPGILIGLAIAAVGIYAWNYAEDVATKKMTEKFLKGYEQAEDKAVFTRNYDFGGTGVSVGVSTSSANEDSDRCRGIIKSMMEVNRMRDYVFESIYYRFRSGEFNLDQYHLELLNNRDLNILSRETNGLNYEYSTNCMGEGDNLDY
jgi:hypothetical protein